MWHSADGMGWWMLAGSVWFVLFWAIVIYVVVRLTNHGAGSGQYRETPLEIVQRRYAAGEIDKDQYDRMRRELT